MLDNTLPHTCTGAQNYLARDNIRVLEWPACSADLSPKRRNRACRNNPGNAEQLIRAVEEWIVPRQELDKLISNMLCRIQAYIGEKNCQVGSCFSHTFGIQK